MARHGMLGERDRMLEIYHYVKFSMNGFLQTCLRRVMQYGIPEVTKSTTLTLFDRSLEFYIAIVRCWRAAADGIAL